MVFFLFSIWRILVERVSAHFLVECVCIAMVVCILCKLACDRFDDKNNRKMKNVRKKATKGAKLISTHSDRVEVYLCVLQLNISQSQNKN